MKKIFFLLLITTGLINACKKATDLEMPRLFRPQLSGSLTADSNTIVAAWQNVSGATAYQLQLSRDTFRTVDLSITLDTNVAVVKQLLFNQLYQLQVRAIAADTSRNSKWDSLGAIKTLSSILKVPGLDDITVNSVRVKWTTKGAPVTSIKILRAVDSSQVAQAAILAIDATNELKVVTGLQAATPYIILLYSGAEMRGSVNFTTKEPFSGTLIDLTGISGRPGVLTDTLPVIAAGSTVLLKRGETYNIASGVSFNKSLVIMSAPDLTTNVQAKLFFTANFSFTAGANIDLLEFNDVYMYGDNYGSRYVFNNTASANVGKLKFMNCRAEIFRGMVRLQSGTLTINDFIIDNSIIDSIGNYSMLNIAASCTISNISITNSTIYKVEGVVTSAQNSQSLLVQNCTFNEAPLGNSKNYYFDYGAYNVANGITISNSLFGIGKNSAGATTVRGFRAGSATTVYITNNYRTSDYLSAGNDIPNTTIYTRPVSQLWKNAALGDFTIIDNAFPGKGSAGDPRWRL